MGRAICGRIPVSADFSILPERFKSSAEVSFEETVVGFDDYPAEFKIVIVSVLIFSMYCLYSLSRKIRR